MTSYGNYVNLFVELISRLTAAQASGKKLDSTLTDGLKLLEIGPRSDVMGINEMPSIVIDISNSQFTEAYDGALRMMRASVDIDLIVKYPTTDQTMTNRYFDTSNSTGALFFIQTLLDVINENTSQSIDPRLGQNSTRPILATVGPFETHANFLLINVKLSAETQRFTINARSTAT